MSLPPAVQARAVNPTRVSPALAGRYQVPERLIRAEEAYAARAPHLCFTIVFVVASSLFKAGIVFCRGGKIALLRITPLGPGFGGMISSPSDPSEVTRELLEEDGECDDEECEDDEYDGSCIPSFSPEGSTANGAASSLL